MRKLVEVDEAIVEENEVRFIINAQEPVEAVEAADRMIADSDGSAFVYLIDTGTEFIYVQFKEHTWQALGAAIQRDGIPLLQWGKQIMPLASFHEEFWMLLENIEDNDNYGRPFRTAVEEAFREVLTSRS